MIIEEHVERFIVVEEKFWPRWCEIRPGFFKVVWNWWAQRYPDAFLVIQSNY